MTSRRAVITALGTLGLGAASLTWVGCAPGQSEVASSSTPTAASTSTATPACTLATELTEGPYYLDLAKVRSDITEGKAGIPLKLRITVVNAKTCKVIEGAAVDIWHCDALGIYSGVQALNTVGQTFLRGTQITDANGVASFTTIYPGWYPGRALHIHTKVHIGGSVANGGYQGGHVSHTGQFFFDEEITDKVKQVEPYVNSMNPLTPLANDSIYPNQNAAGTLLTLTPLENGNIKAGYQGEVIVGVDPDAIPAG